MTVYEIELGFKVVSMEITLLSYSWELLERTGDVAMVLWLILLSETKLKKKKKKKKKKLVETIINITS
jgi:hypothetical protein